jgi:hypothetical protein
MGTSEFVIISLNTLNRLFHGKSKGEILSFQGIRCVQCGESVNIKIQKTSGGYGFLNGIISEPSCGPLLAKCSKCYRCREQPTASQVEGPLRLPDDKEG